MDGGGEGGKEGGGPGPGGRSRSRRRSPSVPLSSALARPPAGSGERGGDRGPAGLGSGGRMLLFVEVRRGGGGEGPDHVAGRPR